MELGSAIGTLFSHGGLAAYLIFACGIALLVIGTERLASLFFVMPVEGVVALEGIRGHILQKRYTEALQMCNQMSKSLDIGVVRAGLIAVENGREAMKSALGGAVLDVSQRCEKRVVYLALIANVATLLGLLGTITGLIRTFASIASSDPAEKAKLLGMGISEAMYCTAAGLLVGIFAMVVHTLCTSRADSIVGAAQNAGLQLITWVEQSERATGSA